MVFHSRKRTHDSYTPSVSSSRTSRNGAPFRRSSKETIQSYKGSISNFSMHTTSTVGTRKDLIDYPEQGPGGAPSMSGCKSLYSLEKPRFRCRNQSQSTEGTIRDVPSVRSSTAISTSEQEIRSLIPSFEDDDESPLHSTPRPSVVRSHSTQAECDSDSDDGDLESMSTSDVTTPTTPSEQDSPRHPTPRAAQLGSWTAFASGDTMRPSPSQLTLTPHLNGRSRGDSDDGQSITSPSSDSQAGESVVSRNSTPSPVPPKRRIHILSGILKSRDNYTASAPSTPTYAAASQLSLPLNHLGSPSKPHRGEGVIARTLFGFKGKKRNIDPNSKRPPEPLDAWDMLNDVERDVPPASSIPEQFPCSPGPSTPGLRLLSPDPRRQGARSKHRSLLNHRVLPPPLPLASSIQSTHVPLNTLKPSAAVDNPTGTRVRTLRATSSMIWASGRRTSPIPSRTRTVTAPTSPSTASVLSSVANANVDHDADTHEITVARGDPDGAVPTPPVQENEEERFVTPPCSLVRSLPSLPLANRSRHPSPVRHELEGRPGISLRDDGPVPLPLGNLTRSDPHSRLARTPAITPRPFASALHTFAPSNPTRTPSNQPFECQAADSPSPTTTSPAIEDMAAPRGDTTVSIGDIESLIELYMSSPGPTTTIPAAGSVTQATAAATSDPAHRAPTPTNGADSKQHWHYPGRPLPHPPGASQSGPVRPVLLDLFLAGNIPAVLPSYTEVEPRK